MSSTVAARRNITPGMQNARDVICDSDEREDEDTWKCICRKFIRTDPMACGGGKHEVTSHTSIRGS